MFNAGIFKRGFESVEQAQKERQMQSSGRDTIYDFFLKDGQEAPIRFLNDEPISFLGHTCKVGKLPKIFVCTDDAECLGCKQPDSFDPSKPNKASLKVAFLVLDGTVIEKDEMVDGKPTGKKVQYTDQIKVMVRGISDAAGIQKAKEMYGLLDTPYVCSKSGKKNPYTFFPALKGLKGKDPEFWSPEPLSDEAKSKLIEKLPEKYREIAKGEDGFAGVLMELFKPFGYGMDNNKVEIEEPTSLTRY